MCIGYREVVEFVQRRKTINSCLLTSTLKLCGLNENTMFQILNSNKCIFKSFEIFHFYKKSFDHTSFLFIVVLPQFSEDFFFFQIMKIVQKYPYLRTNGCNRQKIHWYLKILFRNHHILFPGSLSFYVSFISVKSMDGNFKVLIRNFTNTEAVLRFA